LSAWTIFVETAGWGGAILILSAYLLVTTGKVTGQSPLFQWMNLGGGAGFVINGWAHGAIPSAALNVIWVAIATFALLRIARRRRTEGV
jgi:hypothetical protein